MISVGKIQSTGSPASAFNGSKSCDLAAGATTLSNFAWPSVNYGNVNEKQLEQLFHQENDRKITITIPQEHTHTIHSQDSQSRVSSPLVNTNADCNTNVAIVTPYDTIVERISQIQSLSNFPGLPALFPTSTQACSTTMHSPNENNAASNVSQADHVTTQNYTDVTLGSDIQLPRTMRLNKFVRRLHNMLIEEKDKGIVEWRRGLLVLHSTHAFAKNLLPKYFNTRNFKTFRRQLNYYGFVHIRSFSTTGSTTTALWVNQDLAKRGSASISSVLLLKRVDPCPEAKTAEGRRVRKEEAVNSVEDIDLCTKSFQLGDANYTQVETSAPSNAHQVFNFQQTQLSPASLQGNSLRPIMNASYDASSVKNITHVISATSSSQSLSEAESPSNGNDKPQFIQTSPQLNYIGPYSQPILSSPWSDVSQSKSITPTQQNKQVILHHHNYNQPQSNQTTVDTNNDSEPSSSSKKSDDDQSSCDAANLLLMLSQCTEKL